MNDNKKKVATYDLETIARPLPDEIINELCKTGNLKDPDKIAAKQAEFRNKLGADPLTAMPCCGAWFSSDEDCGFIMLEKQTAVAEEKFLREYWERLAMFDILVGFNSMAFDAKILLLRSAVRRINIPFKLSMKRYDITGNHIDIRNVLSGSNPFEAGTLSFYLSMFSLEGKTKGIDGSMVADYWNEGLHDEIGAYCLQDCKATLELFNRIKPYFL